MAKTSMETAVQAENTSETTKFEASGAEQITLPAAEFITEAQMERQGDDLTLTAPDGQTVVIEGYFAADPAPLLQGPDGSVLTPALVNSFARSPSEYAAGDTASDESPVGAVEEIKGEATVTRADGTVEKLSIGTPIYQGDIIETAADGAVNITFIDETSMAVSENARLAIDNYTFDPATESGTTNFSVLRGLFVFTSGLIGRDDPDDVKIETPVGSIGIRGTIIAGEILPGGESKISVLEGAIVVSNGSGEQTLSEQFETVKLSGFDKPMEPMGVVPAQDIGSRFNSVGGVLPSLFTVIQDTGGEQSRATMPAQPAQPAAETAGHESSSSPSNTATSGTTESAPQTAPVAMEGIVNLSGPSAGLPSAETAAGLPSSAGTQPSQTFASTAPASPVIAAPIAATGSGTTHTTTTPSQALTQPPPPSVINSDGGNGGTGTTPTTPAPDLRFSETGQLTDVATSGVIGTFSTGVTGTTYMVTAASLDPTFFTATLTSSGLNLLLTTAGAAYLANSLDSLSLGSVTVQATLPDATVLTRTFTPAVIDANAASTYNTATWAGVATLSDNYEDGGQGNNAGYTITALGDVNGDGFSDFAFSNNTTNANQNHSYIVYGGNARLTDVPITSLGGRLSVRTNATPNSDYSESHIAGIGDFDGDGIEDYVIGQGNNGTGGMGAVSIVSGANGAQNTSLTSLPTSGLAGSSVSGVGDIDNDGYADFLFGLAGVSRAYLVHGNNLGWGANGADTTALYPGITSFGSEVRGIGDFNGDGYADFAIGAPAAGGNMNGQVMIYAGNQSGSATTPIHTISGADNEQLGESIAYLGDINGDGLSDIMLGGEGNTARLFLGGDAARDGTIDIGGNYTLTGGNGIGDFNGDGYDDFALAVADSTMTRTYVVFGKDGFSGDINLSFLKNPENALEIRYTGATNTDDVEISSIGDIDGDGYDDFAMGVPDANGAANGNGGMHIVYGRDATSHAATATGNNQALVGTFGSNTMTDNGFTNISMRAGAGSDDLNITSTNFLGLHGGTGFDSVNATGNLDFSNLDFEKMSGLEQLNYTSNGQTLTLTLENLFNLLKTSDDGLFRITSANTLTGNVLNIDGAMTAHTGATNTQVEEALESMSGNSVSSENTSHSGYNAFHIGGYTLLIDSDVTVNIAA